VSDYWSDLRDSISAIVDAYYEEEEEDYQDMVTSGTIEDHIFTDLKRVREWLEP
jgi:hypothetical protein